MSQQENNIFSFIAARSSNNNQTTAETNNNNSNEKPTFSFGFGSSNNSATTTTTDSNSNHNNFLETFRAAFSAPPVNSQSTSHSIFNVVSPPVQVDETEKKEPETRFSINCAISLFSESILGITESKGDQHQVYLLDISDVSNIKKVMISEFDTKIKGQEKVNCGFKNVSLDYESIILNKIESSNQPRKVRGICNLFKREYPVIDRAIISDWKPNSMTLNNVTDTNEKEVIGFVDQLAVAREFGGKNPFLEDFTQECLFTNELILNVENEDKNSPLYTEPQDPKVILLPCENCKERKYALNGLCLKGELFLFDLKERKFTKTVKFTDATMGKHFILKRFMDEPKFIPYLDQGNRLRSFVLSEQKLYEFYWKEQYEEIICVEHCLWVSGQIAQVRITDEDFGFIISTWDKKIVLYKPGPLGESYTEGQVKIIEKENVSTPSIWCSKSKVLFERNMHYNYVPLTFEKFNLTMEDVNKADVKKPSELFNVDEYRKEFEFSCYEEDVNDSSPCLKKVKVEGKLKGLRSEFIYKVQNKNLAMNELEIIAGFENNQSGKDESTNISINRSVNYKSLELKDLTNYLGAPIIYKSRNEKSTQFSSFLDLQDGKKSSTSVIFGDISDASSGTSTMTSENVEFIGILMEKKRALLQ